MRDRWNARDVAFLMDSTKQWRRVEYHATDMVVFAQKFSGEDGPDSVGIWLCEDCFNRDIKTGDLSFLVEFTSA